MDAALLLIISLLGTALFATIAGLFKVGKEWFGRIESILADQKKNMDENQRLLREYSSDNGQRWDNQYKFNSRTSDDIKRLYKIGMARHSRESDDKDTP